MLDQWLQQLDELLSSGRLTEAESFLKNSLQELEEQGRAQGNVWLSLLNELASLYRGASRLKEAEQAFLKVEGALQTSGQEISLPFAAVQINLAGTYRLMSSTDQALERYLRAQECLDSLRRQADRQSARQAGAGPTEETEAACIQKAGQAELDEAALERLAYLSTSVLNNISLLYCDLERYELALHHAREAAAMIRDGVGDEHELATSYNNLASIHLKMEHYEEAWAAAEEALALYDRMPKKNVHHAAALATQAALLFRRGDLEDAEAALERSLALTEHFFGKNAEYESAERSLQAVRRAQEERTG
jgi:tetratricopeptide (TPR) repeat protein